MRGANGRSHSQGEDGLARTDTRTDNRGADRVSAPIHRPSLAVAHDMQRFVGAAVSCEKMHNKAPTCTEHDMNRMVITSVNRVIEKWYQGCISLTSCLSLATKWNTCNFLLRKSVPSCFQTVSLSEPCCVGTEAAKMSVCCLGMKGEGLSLSPCPKGHGRKSRRSRHAKK